MGSTLTTIDSVLKDFYEGSIREQLSNEVACLKYLEKSTKHFDNRKVVFPVHLGRNVGTGFRAAAAALPTAGNQQYQSVNITAAYLYGRLDIQGQAIAASKNSFGEQLAAEVDGLQSDFTFDMGRASYGDGHGTLARVYTTGTLTSITVYNKFAVPGEPGARYVQVGQDVQTAPFSAGGYSVESSGSVTVVTIAANSGTVYDTITVSTSCNVSACGFVLTYGTSGVEMMGLRAIVDDATSTGNCWRRSAGFFGTTTMFNVSRNTYRKWNSYVNDNSSTERVLDSFLIQTAFNAIKKAKGSQVVDYIVGDYDVVSVFADTLAQDRRFSAPNYDAGLDTLSFNGKPLVQDLLAPYNELYFIGKNALAIYELQAMGWGNEDGKILQKVTGYDRYEAFYRGYLNIGPDMGLNGCACIRDIKTDI